MNMENLLLITDIDFTTLIIEGFTKGVIISMSVSLLSLAIHYSLKLLSKS